MEEQTNLQKILSGHFPENYTGTLLEAGGGPAEYISISASFRRLGWEIITIEPNPDFCKQYRDLNLDVLEYAACESDKGETTFKVSGIPEGFSALEVRYLWTGWPDSNFKTINVQALTLNTILKKHRPELTSIDLLIIDTEGWELEVLQGLDLAKYNPSVICMENVLLLPSYTFYLESKGYQLECSYGYDQVYINVKNQEL